MFKNLSNKELVTVTHGLGKTLGADTLLIDIAKLLAESATRLDVATVRGNELKKQLDAVVAENVALKKCAEFYADGFTPFPIMNGPTHLASNALLNDAGSVARTAIKTPASDAILNAVRAEGVELVKAHPSISLCSLTHVCEEIANQLRADAAKDGE